MGATAPSLYERIINCDLHGIEREDVSPFLPLVLRMAAERTHDVNHLRALTRYKDASRVSGYLGVDYAAIQESIEEELRLKAKLPDSRSASFAGSLGEALVSHFEAAENDLAKRVRIVVSELFNLIDSLRTGRAPESEIIANPLYHRELSYIIPIALTNMSVLKLQDVVRALLSLDINSALLIHSIVRNMPSSLYRIAGLLAESAASSNEAWSEKIKTLLLRLCELSPSVASTIRALLLEEHHTLPAVAMLITLKYTNDEVTFVNSLLSPSYGWMRDYLKKLSEDAFPFRALRDKMLFHLQQAAKASPPRPLELARILRIYCGLTGLASIKLTVAEMESVLTVVANAQRDRRVLQLGLCFVLSCGGLLKACGRKPIASALTALLESRRLTEMLLLCAIHMHTAEHTHVVELVRSTVGLKVSVSIEALSALQSVFTEDILPEAALAREAPLLGVVPSLSAQSNSLVPRCVLALLKGRLLLKQKVDVSGWVSQQICEVVEPIHPLLPALMQEYAAACFADGWAMQPLSEAEVRRTFTADNNNHASQLLMLYWVLVYDEAAQLAVEEKTKRGAKPSRRPYSRELTSSLPMKRLHRHAESAPDAYAVLLPLLNSLLVANYPHLFGLVPLLVEQDARLATAAPPPLLLPTHALSGEEEAAGDPLASLAALLSSPLDSTRAPQLALALQALTQIPPESVAACIDSVVDSLLPALLDPSASYEVAQQFHSLWMHFFSVNPYTLALRTLNLFRPAPPQGSWLTAFQHSDIASDPLIALRSDPRIFASPPLFAILLVILNTFLTASRKQVYVQAAQAKATEEHTTLVLAQDAAVVQMLLEVCGRYEATRSQVCSFLHDMFIECPLLIKLVHFQTYDLALLPLTASGIASMHVCFDFLPELLAQSHAQKQVFAVHLAAELSLRYPIQKALPICRSVLAFLAAQRAAPEGERVLLQALPCLAKFCVAFPMLAPDAADLLLDLSPQPMVGVRLQTCSPLEVLVQRVFADIARTMTRT